MTEILRLRPGLEWRTLEGELVGLDPPSSTFFKVNRTGATLWPALAQGATLDQLSTILGREFGLSPEAATADVRRFLELLEGRGLLAAAG